MTAKESWTKILWTIIHDGFAHPVCALLWISGFYYLGDRLHDATVHLLNREEEHWPK